MEKQTIPPATPEDLALDLEREWAINAYRNGATSMEMRQAWRIAAHHQREAERKQDWIDEHNNTIDRLEAALRLWETLMENEGIRGPLIDRMMEKSTRALTQTEEKHESHRLGCPDGCVCRCRECRPIAQTERTDNAS